MRLLLFLLVSGILFWGCEKDKFTTAPQLRFKSVNTDRLQIGERLQITLEFTDAEGDISDSIFVEQVPDPRCATGGGFKAMYKIPGFPVAKNLKGDILITYGYRVSPQLREPLCNFSDTCFFRFMLKDKAQNRSDTISTSRIILVK
jgi:hypothetical protein